MPFFTFQQNDSGGFFDGFETVIVEAANADEANDVALEYGVYFDGCYDGRDCDCCGDRWYRVHDFQADDVPSIYGQPADENDPSILIVHA
jgi:hypothetical protein